MGSGLVRIGADTVTDKDKWISTRRGKRDVKSGEERGKGEKKWKRKAGAWSSHLNKIFGGAT